MTGVGGAGGTWTWREPALAAYDIRRLHCPDCGVITEELPGLVPALAIPAISKTWCSGWPSALIERRCRY